MTKEETYLLRYAHSMCYEIDRLNAEVDRLRAALTVCKERADYLAGIVPPRSQAEDYANLILVAAIKALERK